MFLSPDQVAQTRENTLNNLLGLSSACFAATLHGMSAATIETVELAENEGRQITEKLTENSPGKRPNTRGRTTTR